MHYQGKALASVALAVAVQLVSGPASAAPIVIDFDSLDGTGNVVRPSPYIEDGFSLSLELGQFASFHSGSAFYTGTPSMSILLASDQATLARTLGDTFGVVSIDLDSLPNGKAATVTFIGDLFGGGTVAQSFTTDAAVPGLQTFTLAPSFQNLVALRWRQADQNAFDHSFDNIRLSVPEPTTIALVGIGLLAAGAGRRRKT
jgi:hypothetical protein